MACRSQKLALAAVTTCLLLVCTLAAESQEDADDDEYYSSPDRKVKTVAQLREALGDPSVLSIRFPPLLDLRLTEPEWPADQTIRLSRSVTIDGDTSNRREYPFLNFNGLDDRLRLEYGANVTLKRMFVYGLQDAPQATAFPTCVELLETSRSGGRNGTESPRSPRSFVTMTDVVLLLRSGPENSIYLQEDSGYSYGPGIVPPRPDAFPGTQILTAPDDKVERICRAATKVYAYVCFPPERTLNFVDYVVVGTDDGLTGPKPDGYYLVLSNSVLVRNFIFNRSQCNIEARGVDACLRDFDDVYQDSPPFPYAENYPRKKGNDSKGHKANKRVAIIVSSVLGSVAVTLFMGFIVFAVLRRRDRRAQALEAQKAAELAASGTTASGSSDCDDDGQQPASGSGRMPRFGSPLGSAGTTVSLSSSPLQYSFSEGVPDEYGYDYTRTSAVVSASVPGPDGAANVHPLLPAISEDAAHGHVYVVSTAAAPRNSSERRRRRQQQAQQQQQQQHGGNAALLSLPRVMDAAGDTLAAASAAVVPGRAAAGSNFTDMPGIHPRPIRLDLVLGVDVELPPDRAVLLGSGFFGEVREGLYQGQRVAVKMLHPSLAGALGMGMGFGGGGVYGVGAGAGPGGGGGGFGAGMSVMGAGSMRDREDAISMFLNEIDMLSRCDHPNITRLLGAGGIGGAPAAAFPAAAAAASLPAAAVITTVASAAPMQPSEPPAAAGSAPAGAAVIYASISAKTAPAVAAADAVEGVAAHGVATAPVVVMAAAQAVLDLPPLPAAGCSIGSAHATAISEAPGTSSPLLQGVGELQPLPQSQPPQQPQQPQQQQQVLQAQTQMQPSVLLPPAPFLVMERLERSLWDCLYGDQPRHLSLDEAIGVVLDIASALAYLHPAIIHRDLKPGNVLLDASGRAKLSDFGLSRVALNTIATAHPEAGTAPYLAPELFDIANNIITEKVDVYALGVILNELVMRRRPWEGFTPLQVMVFVIQRNMRPAMAPDDVCPWRLKKFISACWQADPSLRPSAADALKQLTLLRRELQAGDGSAWQRPPPRAPIPSGSDVPARRLASATPAPAPTAPAAPLAEVSAAVQSPASLASPAPAAAVLATAGTAAPGAGQGDVAAAVAAVAVPDAAAAAGGVGVRPPVQMIALTSTA